MARRASSGLRLAATGRPRTPRACLALLIALAAAAAGGCATSGMLTRSVRDFYRDRPAEAAEELERYGERVGPGDRLLYLLNAGVVHHYMGQYTESNALLESAELRMEELLTRSASREAASFLVNDRTTAYAGAPWEQSLVNYYKALNYALLGDLEEALVECRRVDIRLSDLQARRGGRQSYDEDAFLRYVCGILYEAAGETNDAFVSYRKAVDAYAAQREDYGVPPPPDLLRAALRTARALGFRDEARALEAMAPGIGAEAGEGGAELVVLLHVGRIPRKVSRTIVVPTEQGRLVPLAFPQLQRPGVPRRRVEVRAAGERAEAALATDLQRVASRHLEDLRARVLAKTVARAAAKETLARVARKEGGPWAEILVRLAGALTEVADTRSWETLPALVYVARLRVPPGVLPFEIAVDGRTVADEEVEVREGAVLLRKVRVF
jgi:hypothetical protein